MTNTCKYHKIFYDTENIYRNYKVRVTAGNSADHVSV